MVKQHVDERLGLVDNNIQEVRQTLQDTREQAAEEREKEKRRNNILIYRMPESRDVKLEFFSKSKLESKKSIKTRNSFPVCTGRVAVAEHPVAWWVDCGGPRPTPPVKSVRHVGQGTLGM